MPAHRVDASSKDTKRRSGLENQNPCHCHGQYGCARRRAGRPPAHASAEALIRAKCLPCHTETEDGISRISHQRKTPEGWLMSVARMQIVHGLKITDEERRTVVKHLADRQGLAPSETTGVRYAMERRLNTVEAFESEKFTRCARAAIPVRA